MRRLLPFLVPFLLIAVIGGAVAGIVRMNEARPRGEPVSLPLSELTLSTPFVRVSGMAHYPIRISQHSPGTLFYEERTHYLFPIFEEHDTDSRAIRILIRSEREPEPRVGFELMTLEGRLVQPDADLIPWDTEVILGKRTEYFFTDDMMILEPWRIESDGEVWELPE